MPIGCRPHVSGPAPTPLQAIQSKSDLWGEAALRQKGGPSYEYFEKLLPPIRYVDADFRHYPIVLSAPGAKVKARLVSNGSAINARARQPNWNNESGTPVQILVGSRREPFGEDLARLDGPHYLDGYLPIVRLSYQCEGDRYAEEVFASVDPQLASRGAVMVRFDLPGQDRGRVELRFAAGYDLLKVDAQHIVRDFSGAILAQLDDNWDFQPARSAFISKLNHPRTMTAIIHTGTPTATTRATGAGMDPELEAMGQTRPAPGGAAATTSSSQLDLDFYTRQRDLSIQRWTDLLAAGTRIDVPEPIVNNAWRTLLIAQYGILAGEQMNYSAGNQYARQYSNESGDSIRSLLFYGHHETARNAFKPLFVYRRPGIELHDGAFKLEDLADYYFLTRDAELIRELRPLWQREIDLILSSRQPDGLLPKEAYCSDIRTPVRSLNTNANAWRGLRDMAIVLDEISRREGEARRKGDAPRTGDARRDDETRRDDEARREGEAPAEPRAANGEKPARPEPRPPGQSDVEQSAKLTTICADYRKTILAALDKSIVRTVDPPFVRIALDGEEPVSNPITSTRYGSYWNLVVPCVLWSGIFPIDSEPADAIIQYIQRNGGLCMGMTRVQSARGVWTNIQNIDDLYVIRYSNALLKRDEPDRALITFYGKLAQGFTRETFTDGESTGIEPLDRFGRQVALPPNSTANASLLIQLRNLLVQDQDMDDDGNADTLRLAFATPRRWLADGKSIQVERAPTAFGEVSFSINSDLSNQRVGAEIVLPDRQVPGKIFLRLRLPDAHRIKSVDLGKLMKDGETIDLTGLKGKIALQIQAS